MIIEETIKISSTPEHIFLLYKDVSNWNTWDKEVKESHLNGKFIEGTTGNLSPAKGPKSKILLSKVEENKSFTVESKLPLCLMYFEHILTPIDYGVLVTHRVKFEGPLSFIFGYLIGRQIKQGLPITLKGLKYLAEKENIQNG